MGQEVPSKKRGFRGVSLGETKMTPNKSIESLFTLEDVAKYLNVSTKTIYRLIKEYHLLAVKVINQWRFRNNINLLRL
jgi:excisionase family DNA binding protein